MVAPAVRGVVYLVGVSAAFAEAPPFAVLRALLVRSLRRLVVAQQEAPCVAGRGFRLHRHDGSALLRLSNRYLRGVLCSQVEFVGADLRGILSAGVLFVSAAARSLPRWYTEGSFFTLTTRQVTEFWRFPRAVRRKLVDRAVSW